jgi:hypothetical protein
MRPRQVRYQAALRPDILCFYATCPPRRHLWHAAAHRSDQARDAAVPVGEQIYVL